MTDQQTTFEAPGEVAAPRSFRHNLLCLSTDFIMFMIGFVFWDPTVIVSVFGQGTHRQRCDGGPLHGRSRVGHLPARAVGGQLPGHPAAQKASADLGQPGGPPARAGLGPGHPFLAQRAPWLAVGVLALSVGLFFSSEGMNAISWPDLVAKVLPARIRGRFLGTSQLPQPGGLGVGDGGVPGVGPRGMGIFHAMGHPVRLRVCRFHPLLDRPAADPRGARRQDAPAGRSWRCSLRDMVVTCAPTAAYASW